MLFKPVKLLFAAVLVLITFLTLLKSRSSQKISYNVVFENILIAKVKPKNGQNVFFIDCSVTTEDVTLTPRQACAIESAALSNSHLNVFFLYTSRERLEKLKISLVVQAIMSYPNVFLSFMNITEFSAGTPMESFFKSNKLLNSSFPTEHTSDALRLLVLWKYGGTYLDTDMIVRKPLDSVPPNFACRQSQLEINGAILNFDLREGRQLAELFIEKFEKHFSAKYFVSNGPVLVTRVIKKLCKTDNLDEIIRMKTCKGFNILNTNQCYEVQYSQWRQFMNQKYNKEIMSRVNDSLVVHFWNHESKKIILDSDSDAPYIKLAHQFCPNVIESSGKYF